jgi:hypothetical protein
MLEDELSVKNSLFICRIMTKVVAGRIVFVPANSRVE